MKNSERDAERVRQHVRKVLAQIAPLKHQQRDKPSPVSNHAVEIDRERDGARPIDGHKRPA